MGEVLYILKVSYAVTMFESSRSAQRAPGREHVPLYPKGFIAIRIVQLVVAVIILGLIAYSMSLIIFDGNCLNIFTVS